MAGRVVKETKARDAHGVYEAMIQVFDHARDVWVSKTLATSFFPDRFERDDVEEAIVEAWNGPKVSDGIAWEGATRKGMRIRGFVDAEGTIMTAFPLHGLRGGATGPEMPVDAPYTMVGWYLSCDLRSTRNIREVLENLRAVVAGKAKAVEWDGNGYVLVPGPGTTRIECLYDERDMVDPEQRNDLHLGALARALGEHVRRGLARRAAAVGTFLRFPSSANLRR